mmetsp:Transcript_81867/g.149598  ORF Transcript_81867/g.149598 Transcript_81867/m.149598 type:complete len:144 (-) Transcript_81867:1153-1584(-)
MRQAGHEQCISLKITKPGMPHHFVQDAHARGQYVARVNEVVIRIVMISRAETGDKGPERLYLTELPPSALSNARVEHHIHCDSSEISYRHLEEIHAPGVEHHKVNAKMSRVQVNEWRVRLGWPKKRRRSLARPLTFVIVMPDI